MKPNIRIIAKSIDSQAVIVEFTDLQSGVDYYIIFDRKKEDYTELSIALQGESYYTRYQWNDLTIESQNLIEEIITEILEN